jgi:hypothetical protein
MTRELLTLKRIACLISVVILSATSLLAAGTGEHKGCTVADVSGTYAFLANGSVLVPGTPITGPFSRVGYFIADGKGGIQISALPDYNGINFGQENFGGTYTVTSDCAFDLQAIVPAPIFANAEFKGQVALDGNQITFLLVNTQNPQAPAITTVAGFGTRREAIPGIPVPLTACTADILEGSWSMEINGFINLPPFGTGTPYRQVGSIQLDGKSGMLGSFVTSNNGTISQQTASGTYTVSHDCTFDLSYTIGATAWGIRGSIADPNHAVIALNNPGPAVPNVGILTGAVATGNLLRQSGGILGFLSH